MDNCLQAKLAYELGREYKADYISSCLPDRNSQFSILNSQLNNRSRLFIRDYINTGENLALEVFERSAAAC